MSCPTTLSKLSYWEDVFEKEDDVNKSCGDVGYVWYGEDFTETLVEKIDEVITVDMGKDRETVSIFDIGCGNGYTSKLMFENGYKNIYGSDYSVNSIKMSQRIMKEVGYEHVDRFEVMDVLNNDCFEKV